jgi:hypothetical protein
VCVRVREKDVFVTINFVCIQMCVPSLPLYQRPPFIINLLKKTSAHVKKKTFC